MGIDIKDYFVSVARDKVSGHDQIFKYAINEDVDIAEDILSKGGDVVILDDNETIQVVSDNANDTFNGTGIQQILVTGTQKNANGTIKNLQELVELNGATPVTLENEYISIWDVRNIRSGSNRINVGTIDVQTTLSQSLSEILPDKGSSLSSLISVPDGYTMIIYDVFINLGVVAGSSSARSGTITARSLNYLTNAENVEAQIGCRDDYAIDDNFRMPLSIQENNFFWFRADFVENTNTSVQVAYTVELIKNTSNR